MLKDTISNYLLLNIFKGKDVKKKKKLGNLILK